MVDMLPILTKSTPKPGLGCMPVDQRLPAQHPFIPGALNERPSGLIPTGSSTWFLCAVVVTNRTDGGNVSNRVASDCFRRWL